MPQPRLQNAFGRNVTHATCVVGWITMARPEGKAQEFCNVYRSFVVSC